MADDGLESLALAAAAGDRAALDPLLREIAPKVLAICARMLPHRQDAEEASQDALLQVARRIETFRGTSKFTTWLHVVASNSARSTYRSLRRSHLAQAGPAPQLEPADPRTTSVIAGTRLDLLDALDTLGADRADLVAPLVLRDVCGLSYAEIAAELAIPMGTVKSRVHEARARVRRLMAQH